MNTRGKVTVASAMLFFGAQHADVKFDVIGAVFLDILLYIEGFGSLSLLYDGFGNGLDAAAILPGVVGQVGEAGHGHALATLAVATGANGELGLAGGGHGGVMRLATQR